MTLDRQGDHATELAIATLMEDGDFAAHIRRMHRRYEKRREVFFEAIRQRLSKVLSFREPPGGLAIWARVSPDVCVSEWVRRADEAGVLVQDGRHFFPDGRARQYLRLGYARHDEAELVEGVRRLACALSG